MWSNSDAGPGFAGVFFNWFDVIWIDLHIVPVITLDTMVNGGIDLLPKSLSDYDKHRSIMFDNVLKEAFESTIRILAVLGGDRLRYFLPEVLVMNSPSFPPIETAMSSDEVVISAVCQIPNIFRRWESRLFALLSLNQVSKLSKADLVKVLQQVCKIVLHRLLNKKGLQDKRIDMALRPEIGNDTRDSFSRHRELVVPVRFETFADHIAYELSKQFVCSHRSRKFKRLDVIVFLFWDFVVVREPHQCWCLRECCRVMNAGPISSITPQPQ